jgi:opacity protein-like surface antigen
MYLGGQIGVAIPFRLQNAEGTGLTSDIPEGIIGTNTSIMYGGKIGYFFPATLDWLGLEADISHKTPDLKTHTYVVTQPNGTSNSITQGIKLGMTVAALRVEIRSPDIEGWGGFQPYGGIGPALFYVNSSTGGISSRDTSLGFSFQAGTRYFINPALALFVEYKLDAAMVQLPTAVGPGAGLKGDYTTHNIAFGLSYHFRQF